MNRDYSSCNAQILVAMQFYTVCAQNEKICRTVYIQLQKNCIASHAIVFGLRKDTKKVQELKPWFS